jgi:hypothetical protein
MYFKGCCFDGQRDRNPCVSRDARGCQGLFNKVIHKNGGLSAFLLQIKDLGLKAHVDWQPGRAGIRA